MRTMSDRSRRVKPMARPKPGRMLSFPRRLRRTPATGRGSGASLRIGLASTLSILPALGDLVEKAAVGEVGLLRLRPAAEHLVDGEELHLGELGPILG